MSRRRRVLVAVIRGAILPVLVAALLGAPAPATGSSADGAVDSYRPADEPPFGGRQAPPLLVPDSQRLPPPGFRLAAREAIEIAGRVGEVREQAAERSLRAVARTRGAGVWQVSYVDPGGVERARAFVDDRRGELIEVFSGSQIEVPLARGYEDAVGANASEWWLWVPLCVLFVAPFVDPRRPFRLVHLDMLVLLGLGASLFFFNRGQIEISVPLVYPVLGYVFARFLALGLRGPARAGPGGSPLVPLLARRWLAVGIVALVALHGVIAATGSKVIDVGLAGVVGADRLVDGDDVYGQGSAAGLDIRGDVYGPVNYLAYVPFEQAFPLGGAWDSLPAARYAALGFDLLAAFALFLLGRRLGEGNASEDDVGEVETLGRGATRGSSPNGGGVALGIALAYAWLAYPFTVYTLASGFNDALVPLGVALALTLVTRPVNRALAPPPRLALRGAVTALAGLTKFGPLALAPLLAAGRGERSPRQLAPFLLGFGALAALVAIPLLPDGGFRELYDRSLGYQAARSSPFSVWGLEPSLGDLQTAAKLFAVALAVAVFFYPRRRDSVQVVALAGAVIVATQVAASHWFYPYAVWFAPLLLAAAFAREAGAEPAPGTSTRGRP